MKVKITKYKHWPMKEWTCCGHLWQLLLSPKFPERDKWEPICPTCSDYVKLGKGEKKMGGT